MYNSVLFVWLVLIPYHLMVQQQVLYGQLGRKECTGLSIVWQVTRSRSLPCYITVVNQRISYILSYASVMLMNERFKKEMSTFYFLKSTCEGLVRVLTFGHFQKLFGCNLTIKLIGGRIWHNKQRNSWPCIAVSGNLNIWGGSLGLEPTSVVLGLSLWSEVGDFNHLVIEALYTQ